MALFFNTVRDCDTVGMVRANFSSMVFCMYVNASYRTVAVILPSDDIFLISAVVFPVTLAMASITTGMFSDTDRNSSPCSLPELNAWLNWSIDAEASWAVAPDTINALLTVSVNRMDSSWLLPMIFRARSKRVKDCVVAVTSERVRLARSNIFDVRALTCP